MYIEQREFYGAIILDCCGQFDKSDHDQFLTAITQLNHRSCHHLILNFTSLYFLDTQVTSLLRMAHEHVIANSRLLSLVSQYGPVRTVINRLNVHEFIPIFTTVHDALHRSHTSSHQPPPIVTSENNPGPPLSPF